MGGESNGRGRLGFMEGKIIFYLCFLICFLLIGNAGVKGSSHHHHHSHRHLFGFRPLKLFVFGDSYADTGNIGKTAANSWKVPYGITFPGKPAGRFSDGRVLTDYLARFVGIKSPIPYRWRNLGAKHLRYGMNFAFGGTGVFDTLVALPNMTTQVDFLQELLSNKVYTWPDLQSSVALVSIAGNDYGAYLARGGSSQWTAHAKGWNATVQSKKSKYIAVFHSSGGGSTSGELEAPSWHGNEKVAVTSLEPLGCLPQTTVSSSFQECNGTQNTAVTFHNLLLSQAVTKLNNETKDSPFVILDLYASFMSVFENKADHLGSSKFENPLKPCCMGISSEYSCGSVDESGAKKYTICDDPESAFFWDTVHPTQQGWNVVYSALQGTLQQLHSLY
ncbi:GDSL esterase/lipase [Vitis vinifera]|uniref:GDSL esterase/lipase n=1 Tax=Vitis vinifera TaxID=29760 RepID=A0A438EK38_VITVI|nr:GDSL esterase/lipase [Vitis vinifera]